MGEKDTPSLRTPTPPSGKNDKTLPSLESLFSSSDSYPGVGWGYIHPGGPTERGYRDEKVDALIKIKD